MAPRVRKNFNGADKFLEFWNRLWESGIYNQLSNINFFFTYYANMNQKRVENEFIVDESTFHELLFVYLLLIGISNLVFVVEIFYFKIKKKIEFDNQNSKI